MSAFRLQSIRMDSSFDRDPVAWLTSQARQHGLRYLLAHADDGVIWGRVDDAGLLTSHSIASDVSPVLRAETLQQCRMFGLQSELFIWRGEGDWCARLVIDENVPIEGCFDEDQLLWGTHVERTQDGFTLLRDGAQGLRHAVPILVTREQLQHHQLRLRVRHYLVYNCDGEARVTLSRLVNLLPEASERRPE